MSRKTLDLKQRIVDRALELFNQHGLERVGIRELARDLDLSPGNLTYHFARKEDLIVAIAARFSADNSEILTPQATAPTFGAFVELLRPVFRNQYRYRCLSLNVVNVLDEYPDFAPRYRTTQALRRAQFEQWLQQLQAAQRLRSDLTSRELDWLVSYCATFGRNWMLDYWIFRRDQPIEQAIGHSLSVLATAFLPYANTTGRGELEPYLEPLARLPEDGSGG